MHAPRLFRISGALVVIFFGVGCAELQTEFSDQQKPLSDTLKTALAAPNPEPAYWNDEEFQGTSRIVVHLDEQRAFFYKGKHLVGESNISTGRKGYETPPGKYHIIQKDKDHVSSEYGNYIGDDGDVVEKNVDRNSDHAPKGSHFDGAKMPYFLRFTRGYGMHAGFVPRFRASHGCIRMPREMAAHFFHAAEVGTPVIVKE